MSDRDAYLPPTLVVVLCQGFYGRAQSLKVVAARDGALVLPAQQPAPTCGFYHEFVYNNAGNIKDDRVRLSSPLHANHNMM